MKKIFNYIVAFCVLSVLLSTQCPDKIGDVTFVVKNASSSKLQMDCGRVIFVLQPADSIAYGEKRIADDWTFYMWDITHCPHPKIIAEDGRVFKGDIFDRDLYEKSIKQDANSIRYYTKYMQWTLTITDDDLVAAE